MDRLLSYVQGATEPALLEDTIGDLLVRAAATWPDGEALVCAHQSVRWTWPQLLEKADQLAAGFTRLGLAPGDRLGVWGPNSADWAWTQFAAARAGLILTNLNPAYRATELEYALNKAGVKAIVCAERHKTSDYVAILESLAPELVASTPGALACERLPSLRAAIRMGGTVRNGWLTLGDVSEAAADADIAAIADLAPRLDRNDAANIQFTSGTTGHPKGATLTHRNLVNNALFVGLGQRLGPADRLCIPVPLYHCFGMVMGNLACLVHGATMVYPSEGFDPLATLQTLERERCTALYGVPTMFIAELDHPEFWRFDFSSLRTGLMAGSPCPVEVMRRVIKRMHMPEVGIAYGMTETSPVSFQTAPEDPIERRVATVGQVQPHLEVKVVDEAGAVVPRGAPGELCTRGYSVMQGYWDDAARTAEVLDADGWMHTGDIGVIDDEGYASVVGRIKDMIIRGGENVYPREIEEYLLTHPAVADVQVIGVPDAKYGEAVCAWVRLHEGAHLDEAGLQAFCCGQIAHFKVPKYVRFVDAFPMTVTGKVQKFQMRAAMIEALEAAAR